MFSLVTKYHLLLKAKSSQTNTVTGVSEPQLTTGGKGQALPLHAAEVCDRKGTPRLRDILYRDYLKVCPSSPLERHSLSSWNASKSLWKEERSVSFLCSSNVFREENVPIFII